jgi:6,7-dimethyl-8-ribityllumazine synthase
MSQWDEQRPVDAEALEKPAEEPQQPWPGDAPTAYAAEDDVSLEDAAPAEVEEEPAPEPVEAEAEAEPEAEVEPEPEPEPAPMPTIEHVSGGLQIPEGYTVVEGEPKGARRAVAVVVGRFNGEITSGLLTQALDELQLHGVSRSNITVVPVPGAFELPLAVMALAKTRRYACIVALGCVIRGETPHFDFVATEAASGLQLASLETGTPIAFGVLTTETVEQARERVTRGADAARSALEMAEVFTQLRAANAQ